LRIICFGANGSTANQSSVARNRAKRTAKRDKVVTVSLSCQPMLPPCLRPKSRKKMVKTKEATPGKSIRLNFDLRLDEDMLMEGSQTAIDTDTIAMKAASTCMRKDLTHMRQSINK
jgi:hypothetical protein